MKAGVVLVTFGLGVVVGVIGVLWAPPYLDPYVPSMVSTKDGAVEGTVVKKQLEPERLLLTLSTPQGSVLAIFNKKIEEIDLLVDENDIVTLRLRHYEPFVDDPTIQRVHKEGSPQTSEDARVPPTPTNATSLPSPPTDTPPPGDKPEERSPEP